MRAPAYVFGYGSLLFRPGFPYRRALPATLAGWERCLHQGSPDHRGTPERPGRVATLAPTPGAVCAGLAYELPEEEAPALLAALDVREQAGYERHEMELTTATGERLPAVTWVALPHNPHYLGPAPLELMAAQIRRAIGPSGSNVDYVLSLDRRLRELRIEDARLAALARLLTEG